MQNLRWRKVANYDACCRFGLMKNNPSPPWQKKIFFVIVQNYRIELKPVIFRVITVLRTGKILRRLLSLLGIFVRENFECAARRPKSWPVGIFRHFLYTMRPSLIKSQLWAVASFLPMRERLQGVMSSTTTSALFVPIYFGDLLLFSCSPEFMSHCTMPAHIISPSERAQQGVRGVLFHFCLAQIFITLFGKFVPAGKQVALDRPANRGEKKNNGKMTFLPSASSTAQSRERFQTSFLLLVVFFCVERGRATPLL